MLATHACQDLLAHPTPGAERDNCLPEMFAPHPTISFTQPTLIN